MSICDLSQKLASMSIGTESQVEPSITTFTKGSDISTYYCVITYIATKQKVIATKVLRQIPMCDTVYDYYSLLIQYSQEKYEKDLVNEEFNHILKELESLK